MNFRDFTTFGEYLGEHSDAFIESANSGFYADTGLEKVFDQRFRRSSNSHRMIVTPACGLYEIQINGPTISISDDLFKLADVSESSDHIDEPITELIAAESIGTSSFLNQEQFFVLSFTDVAFDQPIFIKVDGEFETMNFSSIMFRFKGCTNGTIVEEHRIGGFGANMLSYSIHDSSVDILALHQNSLAATDLTSRMVTVMDGSQARITVANTGCSVSIDETAVRLSGNGTVDYSGHHAGGPSSDTSTTFYSYRDTNAATVEVSGEILTNSQADMFFYLNDTLEDMSEAGISQATFMDREPEERRPVILQKFMDRLSSRFPVDLALSSRFTESLVSYSGNLRGQILR